MVDCNGRVGTGTAVEGGPLELPSPLERLSAQLKTKGREYLVQKFYLQEILLRMG